MFTVRQDVDRLVMEVAQAFDAASRRCERSISVVNVGIEL